MKKETIETAIVKMSLEDKVKQIANYLPNKYVSTVNKKFNLKQFASEKENLLVHRDICIELIEISKKHNNYPICYLVYFAIGKNAHRSHVFEAGYSKIDTEKAETILLWLELFAKYNNNPKLVTNTDLSHVLCKYYEKVSKKSSDFRKLLKTYEKNEKIDNFKKLAIALKIE